MRHNVTYLILIALLLALPAHAAEKHSLLGVTPEERRGPPASFYPFSGKDDDTIAKDLQITTAETREDILDIEKIYSSNNIYWFVVREHKTNASCEDKDTCPVSIYIFSNRLGLTQLKVKEVYTGASIVVDWVNDKLLYVEYKKAFGAGAYFIFDTEKSTVVSAEKVFYTQAGSNGTGGE